VESFFTVMLAHPNKWLGDEGLHLIKHAIGEINHNPVRFPPATPLCDPPLVLVATRKKIYSFLLALLVFCTTGKIFPAKPLFK
jgi:hypothetical protein